MTELAIDAQNAFADQRPKIPGTKAGVLQGLSFAAKDLFDVAGHVTGCGNPVWARTHSPAAKTASAIERLVREGASLVGKTHTDELAYSLNGENHFYGTPLNPRAPDRIPGGSSSGSASAVAGSACDFALGTDTGGSVRVPASYCGLYGIRPTHGRIPIDGCMALAPSFDTVGWFARTPHLLEQVGEVLLGAAASPPSRSWLLAEDLLSLCDDPVLEIVDAKIDRIDRSVGTVRRVILSNELPVWLDSFRILQAAEVWRLHGEWVSQANPTFGPGVRERFAWAASLRPAEIKPAQKIRKKAVARLRELLADGTILLMPTAPCFAPFKGLSQETLDPLRRRILSLTCPAGLGGLPQVTLPLETAGTLPVGLSLLGWRGCDAQLLSIARKLAPI